MLNFHVYSSSYEPKSVIENLGYYFEELKNKSNNNLFAEHRKNKGKFETNVYLWGSGD